MKTAKGLRFFGMAAIAAVLLMALGCEENKNISDPTSELGAVPNEPTAGTIATAGGTNEVVTPSTLTITPPSATIASIDTLVVFTAAGGQPPYSWSVANGNGTITPTTAGNQATYAATSVGFNTVIVKDSLGQSVSASIAGSGTAALVVTANPPSLSVNFEESSLTVSGGVSPYTWKVVDTSLGAIVSQAGVTASYQRSNAGDNTVTVTDADGNNASIVIAQP